MRMMQKKLLSSSSTHRLPHPPHLKWKLQFLYRRFHLNLLKHSGHTKSTTKRLKTKDLEAQKKVEVEAVLAESLKEEAERAAKEKVEAEQLEAALRLSKEEATINIPSEDSDEVINTILETPINEGFLQSSAPASTSEVPPQTQASEDVVVESSQVQTELEASVASPSSSII